MNEILNEYGLPDEMGFEIKYDMFKMFFDNEQDYNVFLNSVSKISEKIIKNYGIPDTINFKLPINFCIQSFNGKKCIVIDKFYIISALYRYFNKNDKYAGNIYLNIDSPYEENVSFEISELKKFLTEKIQDLEKVNDVDELKNISNALYHAYEQCFDKRKKIWWNKWFKKELQGDIEVFKKLKIWLSQFIDDMSKSVSSDNLYSSINKDKFKFYLACQYLVFAAKIIEPNKSLLVYNSKKIIESINDKDITFEDIWFLDFDEKGNFVWQEAVPFKYIDIKNYIDSIMENKNAKRIMDVLGAYEKENSSEESYEEFFKKIIDLINKAIEKSNEIGAKDIDLNELNTKIKNKLLSEQTIEKQNLLRSYINRIEFYLNEFKPYKVQEGNGLFKGFHILYFTNGTVAIDKLNGTYGYLYVMPINTYYDILNNNLKNIMEIRSILTVKSISHKSINWKELAYNEINNHSITNEEYEILESILGSTLPITDKELEQAKKKYSDNQYLLSKIKEKEEERKIKFEEIDNELKQIDNSDYTFEQEDLESKILLEAEDEISSNFSNCDDLLSIYEFDNKIKTRRNPKVSLDTKLRTIGPNGAMRCEMCGEFESFDTHSFDSHHIIPLSEGGVDNVYNTVCLCGNCHKRMHGNIPFTFNQKWKMLMTVRNNLEKSTPYYVEKFDRLFNPNYNYLYNNNLSNDDSLEQYKREEQYYSEHKDEEDNNFLTEWNSYKK